MRIFLTGATGYLGSAIASAFLRAGHDVTALVRSQESASRVAARGMRAFRGELRETQTYREEAHAHDVIVHAGIEEGPDRLVVDRAAAEALASPRLVYTSTMFVLGDVDDVDESAMACGLRASHEQLVVDAGGAVIRPGMVVDEESWLVQRPLYVGEGRNRWPIVHRDDAAELYRLVAERRAGGIFHAVCHVIRARDFSPDATALSLEEARRELGAFADALAMDQNVRTTRSRELGWTCSVTS